MRTNPRSSFFAAVAASLARHGQAVDVDLGWYPPNATAINNLTQVVNGEGVYGFIYNNSNTPADEYGIYNWCNMPHVRKTEYVKPAEEYTLQYVEVIHRHHKRTVYASNSFPVESYGWNCDDEGLFYYGQPKTGNVSAASYWQGYISPQNPFIPSGFLGTCQFPQITAGGLDDSWQHGQDLYGVYHDLLGFLPSDMGDKVTFRVTQNVITSEVAGMVINGMFDTVADVPLLIEASGVDSLEPTYTCTTSSNLFSAIESGSNWTAHLTAASSLYATLDNISGVSPTDSGFHASFDHYYDNLSARQCHAKPLPCKLVNGVNSTTCVTQDIADEVYRFGNYEYSFIYRDDYRSLAASYTSYGIWIGELTTHLRASIAGNSSVIYRHNVAHDGSMSRLLSVLQVDVMIWPGMGSEVVFELYKKGTSTTSAPSATPTACNHDNCLRQFIASSASASAFCPTFTATAGATLPTFASNCDGDVSRVLSACSCVVTPTATSAPTSTATASTSGYYIRVLWGGKVLRSSNPSLGLMDMVPVETLLTYFDGLAGVGASLVYGKCNGSIAV
ncbi:phosphoglycerate mutase-like protein [Mollisia scopiformis]|uniref:Phosphoglycerate mutase-like protein n=1 Tax=Mollisia scopiformis TaxID=149040 RepID=A0A194WZV2_MOLSC|nr:phosphoglycerate mutase-like protein [Mollisia scopiformis]KUJ13473.1 phosphoglycerate mutase-like protein [Mollisia scopiformis]